MSNFQFIETHIEDRIFYITMTREEKRNALNSEMVGELKEAFRHADKDEGSRIVILKGRGPAFSAGADLAYIEKLQENTYEENLKDSTHLRELFEIIYNHSKISIAQVEGHAIAGGCGLATICDFVFSVPEAKFGYTEVKIGFIPAIVMVFLIRKIGEAAARKLLLTGKLIPAEEAVNIGLANELYGKEAIGHKTKEFALELIEKTSPASIKITREMIAKVQSMDVKEALDYAQACNAKARDTEDCKKGISSFLNKEPLKW